MTIAWQTASRAAGLLAAAMLLVMIAAAAAPPDAVPPAGDLPEAEPPAGQLLVAAASLQDPRFRHSVVLLVRHDKTGAFGIIINRPLTERPLAELLSGNDGGSGSKPDVAGDTIQVFFGGPVQPQLGFVVHSSEYRLPQTLAVGDRLAMTANADVLRAIATHQGPAKYLFAVGYAGWGAGQLEGEIARRDWFTAPSDPELVFDMPRDAVWDSALARRLHEL